MKTDPDTQARRILKSAKLYCTAGRLAVVKVLLKAENALRQDQIAKRLGKNQFDKVTIYRTLETLAKAGIVHKAFVEDRARHFELAHNCTDTQCHPHFTCTNCGRTHCLTKMSLPKTGNRHKGFVIHRQQTLLEGLCPACA